MNISGLIRSLVGDLTAADTKVLELKVGQIVKGVVLQLLSDQDALLNIGGVQVRAKLETPLKQGDVTMLQVQPESSGGQIMLKPLESSDVQIADDSLTELLKAFSLKDNASNRQMVQTMQREGVPLTKETVQSFAALLGNVPEGVHKDEWLQAAALVVKKGLPLTQEAIAAMRQATTGPAVGQVLERLEQQASALLKEQPAHPAADTAKQVVSLLKELRASAAAAGFSRPPEAPAAPGPAPAAPQAGGIAAAAPAGAPPVSTGSEAAPAAPTAPAASPAGFASPASAASHAEGTAAGPAAPQAAARPAVAAEPLLAQARSAEPSIQGEPPEAGSPAPEPPPAKPKAAETQQAQMRSTEPIEAADPEPNWISKMLKAVGVEHEAHVARLDERMEAPLRPRAGADDLLQSAIVQTDAQDDAAKPAADNLKSLLLQLAASDDTPAPLKEAAQQAIHQITGQQLMLTGDKSSMFAHITLFIPFMDGTGQQSAAVHIQSQKGKRGEVDASNCRLLFDLQMKSMGNTLVDVHVVNKIVSLNIHNDHPAVALLMENSREEITAAMNNAGYQFFSLKCSPYPTLPAIKESDAPKQGQGSNDGVRADLRSLYQPKPYKGVDFRA
ncbi:hypothetical protein [Paenibacillus sedimenti]|uniref:Flagellar hook-length control protein FliK n=1 Tax=Paenibacillus sedimenti TaxID=2770274 RepID=A0A926KP70_9BACL|nr:hypothetical protein [Paenibacillus sedimenti]MBD0380376.1 hypothetical protein [Paenibacillus sedimenti]